MKQRLFTVCLFSILFAIGAKAERVIELKSPNNKLNITVKISNYISYDLWYNNDIILKDNEIKLTVDNTVLGLNPILKKEKRSSISETITPIVALKYKSISNQYNKLLLSFNKDYSIEFRAYNEGVAYRFITNINRVIEVKNEEFSCNFPSNYLLHLQQPSSFNTAYEEPYSKRLSNEWKETDKISTLPILIDTQTKHKVLMSESALSDYPCMFIKAKGSNGIATTFPKVPIQFGENGDRSLKILKEADYIAKTNGKRDFPWRYFIVTDDDKQLLENTMTLKLADKCELTDTSWIKPGQVSWEWWNDASPYGADVNFESGYNLNTYKYYIDFASKFGIPYIIMDEGWAKSTLDPFTPNPQIDLHELIRYGKEKKVGIVLWLTWLTVENNFNLFKTFNEWGIKGVKIDFMDRSDQWMVRFYEKVAKEAANNHLFVDFHGSFKPAGLEYKYPNILSYEGVRGMEQMEGCTPDNSLLLPFMRNAVGPMDYTPGAMISMQPDVYCSQRPNSASIGTRAYQMALFVIFESGLQMLADNPTQYYRNEECAKFITQVPTTWDETIALEAKAGEYAIIAKRKNNKWYIGGITNNKEKTREFCIDLQFLTDNKTYQMTSFEDGINAGRQAMDYRINRQSVNKKDKILIKLVRNGGFAAIIE